MSNDIPLASQKRPNGDGTHVDRFVLVAFKDIKLSTRRQYLIKGLLPREGLALIWGPPGCGKSFLAYDMAMHIALGQPFRGRRTAKGPVVYVACEGEPGIPQRTEAYKQARFLAEIDDVPFFMIMAKVEMPHHDVFLAIDIKDQIGSVKPAAIFIDTLNRSFVGSENKDEDMGAYIRAADRLYRAFGCCVAIIHHSGVEGTRYRGHTSLKGAVDAEIEVAKADDGLITAKVIKMKDGADGTVFTNRLKVIDLGLDEDGEEMTSCVIEPSDEEPAERVKKLSPNQQKAFDELKKCMSFAGSTSQRGTITVSLETWQRELFNTGVIERDSAGYRDKWAVLKRELKNRGRILFDSNRVWIISDV